MLYHPFYKPLPTQEGAFALPEITFLAERKGQVNYYLSKISPIPIDSSYSHHQSFLNLTTTQPLLATLLLCIIICRGVRKLSYNHIYCAFRYNSCARVRLFELFSLILRTKYVYYVIE